jgi:hypothetical protein
VPSTSQSSSYKWLLIVVIQRYLGVRLDFLGNLLVLGIGLIGVGFRTSVDPSKLGVVMTYALTIVSLTFLAFVVRMLK